MFYLIIDLNNVLNHLKRNRLNRYGHNQKGYSKTKPYHHKDLKYNHLRSSYLDFCFSQYLVCFGNLFRKINS